MGTRGPAQQRGSLPPMPPSRTAEARQRGWSPVRRWTYWRGESEPEPERWQRRDSGEQEWPSWLARSCPSGRGSRTSDRRRLRRHGDPGSGASLTLPWQRVAAPPRARSGSSRSCSPRSSSDSKPSRRQTVSGGACPTRGCCCWFAASGRARCRTRTRARWRRCGGLASLAGSSPLPSSSRVRCCQPRCSLGLRRRRGRRGQTP